MLIPRYLAVVFPVTSKTIRTITNTQKALCLVWAVSLLFSSPALYLHGLVESRAAENQVSSLKILFVIDELFMSKRIYEQKDCGVLHIFNEKSVFLQTICTTTLAPL